MRIGVLSPIGGGDGGVMARGLRRRWNVARSDCWICCRTFLIGILGGGIGCGSMISRTCLLSSGAMGSIFGGGGGGLRGGSAGISAALVCASVIVFAITSVAMDGSAVWVPVVLWKPG